MAEVLTLTTDQGPHYELSDTWIRRYDGSKHEEIVLEDIRRVRAGRLGTTGTLELEAKDGAKLIVISDRKAVGESATRYRAFVEELHRRIVQAGHLVEFLGARQVAPIVSTVVALAMLALTIANPMHYASGRIIMISIVGGLMLLGALAMLVQSRKRDYDPLKIPPHLVP